MSRLAGLRFPQTAYEVVEALEGMPRAAGVSLLRGGSDPWVRAALARGAGVVALGLFAVELGEAGFYWPVAIFDLSPVGRPDRVRMVSLAMPVMGGADEQERAVWLVRSFVRLRPAWGLWMGDRAGGPSLVNGDRPGGAPTPTRSPARP